MIKLTDEQIEELINLLYSVEEYLNIYEDYYCNLDGPFEKPFIEQNWKDKRDRLVEIIRRDNNVD